MFAKQPCTAVSMQRSVLDTSIGSTRPLVSVAYAFVIHLVHPSAVPVAWRKEDIDFDDNPDNVEDVDIEAPDDYLPGIEGLVITPGRGAHSARADTALEPVFFHSYPVALFREWVHCFAAAVWCDFTAGCGHSAMACLESKCPYFGLTMTDVHREELVKRLLVLVYDSMKEQGSALYNPSLAKAVCGDPNASPANASAPAAKKQRPSTTPTPKSKPESDAAAANADATDDEGSGEEVEPDE